MNPSTTTTATPLSRGTAEQRADGALSKPIQTRHEARGVGPNAPLRRVVALEVALW